MNDSTTPVSASFPGSTPPVSPEGGDGREDDHDFVIRWLGAPMAAVIAGVGSTVDLHRNKPHPERFAYTRKILEIFAQRGEVHDWARGWFMGTQPNDKNPVLMIRDGDDDAERKYLLASASDHIYG